MLRTVSDKTNLQKHVVFTWYKRIKWRNVKTWGSVDQVISTQFLWRWLKKCWSQKNSNGKECHFKTEINQNKIWSIWFYLRRLWTRRQKTHQDQKYTPKPLDLCVLFLYLRPMTKNKKPRNADSIPIFLQKQKKMHYNRDITAWYLYCS